MIVRLVRLVLRLNSPLASVRVALSSTLRLFLSLFQERTEAPGTGSPDMALRTKPSIAPDPWRVLMTRERSLTQKLE